MRWNLHYQRMDKRGSYYYEQHQGGGNFVHWDLMEETFL